MVSFPKLRAGAAPLCAGPSALSRTYRYIEMHGARTSPCGPSLRQWSLAHASRGRRARERLDGAPSAARCLPHPRVLAPQYAIGARRFEKFAKTQSLLFDFDGPHQEASTSPQQSAVTRVGMGLDASRSSWAWQHGSVDAAGASSKCNRA